MAHPQTDNRTRELARKADEAARTASAVTDEAARVGEQTARAGADMARRGAETARDTLQSGVNMTMLSFEGVNDQLIRAFGLGGPQSEDLARRSSQNLQAISQASSVLARGFQEASREWTNWAQERARKNMDGLNRLLACRSVQDFVATQSDLVRDSLHQVIDTNKRIAELAVGVAEEADRIIQTEGRPDPEKRVH